MIIEKLKQLRNKEISAEENVKGFLKEIEKNDKKGKKINAFLEIGKNAVNDAKETDKKIKSGKAGKLAGLVIGVKANINVKGMHASCASLTLKDYKCGYDASVIKEIKDEDGIIIGICNMDEFACGFSGETSAFGATKNPLNTNLIPGGSSSGSAAAVASGFCDLALGSDTGGSIRNPASHCGLYGLKPAYGSVSRYGLIDLAMSLDQIGTLASDLEGCRLLFDIIKGKDEKDATTSPFHRASELDSEHRKKKDIVFGYLNLPCDKDVKNEFEILLKKIGDRYKIKLVKINYIDLAIATYFPLVYVEFYSATRRFDGRKYGARIEEVCGPEVMRRIIGGRMISKAEHASRYYRKSLAVKELIRKEFLQVFKNVDCILSPTVPRLPHEIGASIKIEDMYNYDALTSPANLAGIAALSMPKMSVNGLPIGLQIQAENEDIVFKAAGLIESL
ncbi:Asp-tRNA(Asn)/Glu-tRNA(Gln) amidotransferase subunit GatA [Candidatus Pacearchaeota archaeon]|nr:Asp-tRNA(Asn)/Glu-tRNA(Gln) amidotransferase subunit GatA [Candidatus Pacearchaeota archaeon]